MRGYGRAIREWAGAVHWRRWLVAAGMLALGVWLLFLDSHSITRRVAWHRELNRLRTQNLELAGKIEELEVKLQDVQSDEVVEEVAREQYGMRRPGDTIYRVRPAP